jgi:hypothetical protein
MADKRRRGGCCQAPSLLGWLYLALDVGRPNAPQSTRIADRFMSDYQWTDNR